MTEHAIQLRFVTVKELHLETFWPAANPCSYEPAPGLLQYSSGPFNAEAATVQVRLRFLSGRDVAPAISEIDALKKAGEQPFHIRAEVMGEFHIDLSRFPIDKIQQWAKQNAPLVLLPFLREHLYALSQRSGFDPILLPMMMVPTLVNTKDGIEEIPITVPRPTPPRGVEPRLREQVDG
jgi:preprotein translocase subunit SecB